MSGYRSISIQEVRSAGILAAFLVLIAAPTAVWAAQGVEGAVDLYRLETGAVRVLSASPASVDGREIEIDTETLVRLPEILSLELLSGEKLEVHRSDGEVRGPESAFWSGWADGRRVILTLNEGVVVGRFETADGLYEILPLPDGSQGLAKLDDGLFPPCSGGVEPDFESSSGIAMTRSAADPADRIDVMAVYTPQARAAVGSTAAIEATIQSAVDITNTAFADSDMIARFNLVHTALANYNDTGNSSTDLNWVANDPDVAALRDLHAADMVSLITEDGGGFCGRGYVMRNPGPGFEAFAFQVTARFCAVGNLTWAHEHGHNLGFEHDPANGVPPGSASYPWSFGHFVDGSYRTVMSYSNQCTMGCTRVPHFSNPGVNHNGVATGIANQRDNHRSGDLVAQIVADFRLASCPLPLGHADYCRDCGPCDTGEGDCEVGQCLDGLVCSQNVGARYGFPPQIDVCEVPCPLPPGHGNYCVECGPCIEGEGDCDVGQCIEGLVCSQNVGADYGFPAHIDVCEQDTGGCSLPLGHGNYCQECGPCDAGEGDCDVGQCADGLICAQNVGADYGFPAHIDVCEQDTGGCSLPLGHGNYCRECGPCDAGEGDCDIGQCAAGLVCTQNVGADYGFPAHIDVCEPDPSGCPLPPGHGDYCLDCGPCSAGEGDCDVGQCAAGLVCSQNVGANYGFPPHIDVCE